MIVCVLLSLSSVCQSKDLESIKTTLNAYKAKLESLDTNGVARLFTDSSQVIEQGKYEGTISNYLARHLGPELAHFKSFRFTNYKVNAFLLGTHAYTSESYTYTIIFKDGKEVISNGFATSLLKKARNEWKIDQTHTSFRRAK